MELLFVRLLVWFGFLSWALYVYYLILYSRGLVRGKDNPLNYRKFTVSVIVAARNEENNIGKLLTSLLNQSYSQELYEVIIIDDRSTDKTAEIVRSFQKRWSSLSLVQIKEKVTGLSPKKYALSEGIKESKGEVILLTDADCIVNRYWVEAMISNFREDVSVVAGFSRTMVRKWSKAPMLSKFENFDFLLMFIAAAGAILSGKYFSCSNQNFAYRRTAYEQVGGFDRIKHILSGDDVNLLQLFRKAGFKVTFSLIRHSYVYTEPVKTTAQLLNQRSRWASNAKWQLQLNPEFFFYLLVVFVLILSPLILLFFQLQVALTLLLLKFVSELFFLSRFFSLFEEEKRRLVFFPVWFILQPLYVLTVTIQGLLGLFRWKPER